jgi:nucleoside-diphosphate-sugar epimerase
VDVLVTGASGFIGQRLCPRLAARHRVFAVTRGERDWGNDAIAPVRADLSRPDACDHLPSSVDAVVALAKSRHYRSFPEEAQDIFNVNVRSLAGLLEWARTADVSRFVYTSSANVYQRADGPIAEDGVIDPLTLYARTKQMAEMLVESYAELIPSVVLRLFTVYGPGQRGALIPSLIDRVAGGRAVELEGVDGLRLSPIFVDDVCAVIERAVDEHPMPRPFETMNVGGREVMGVRQLASAIADALDLPARFESMSDDEPGAWVADVARLGARYDLPALLPFREGLARTIAVEKGQQHVASG